MTALLARWRRPRAAARAPVPVPIHAVARTHVGRVRAINEDRLLDRTDRRLWAVADGMGGHSAGDIAAEAAMAALGALADDDRPITAAAVREALLAANRRMVADHRCTGVSGTTVVAALLEGLTLTLLWAGDSRCYLIRDRELIQLSRDHSVVQQLIDTGLLTPAAAARHPRAHVITRALGIDPGTVLDCATAAMRPGDRVLLCSDGLSRSLSPRDVAAHAPLERAADQLLTNALQRDGSDNIALLLIGIGEEPAAGA